MIGAVADDFTGATDVAVAFRGANLRTLIVFSIPEHGRSLPAADAVVVALKTRTIPVEQAVAQTLAATRWLRDHGATQIFFKYCSTFDSRAEGNIGPVADALTEFLAAPRAVFVPSSPRHQRTQYMGHLFVDQLLLSDSPMRHHPLTPMTNSFIPDVLRAQTARGVGLVDRRDVARGSSHIAELLAAAQHGGTPYVVIDAITDHDLAEIGTACVDDQLVTGAAGLATGLGAAHARRLGRQDTSHALDRLSATGQAAVIAGSCSARTLDQIAALQSNGNPSHLLDAVRDPDAESLAAQALTWYDHLTTSDAPLIYSSLPPEALRRTQEQLGSARASAILETAQGIIAQGLISRGVTRLIIAGGETSGAVVSALQVQDAVIGPEAAAGVPWITTTGDHPVTLLLKSGNFGDPQLLVRASARSEPVST